MAATHLLFSSLEKKQLTQCEPSLQLLPPSLLLLSTTMADFVTVRCVCLRATRAKTPSLPRSLTHISVLFRLFVQTQTYDIPCDPRQPAQWLLMQAKSIQRTNLKRSPAQHEQHSQRDELEVLYNRTTRSGASVCLAFA